MAVHCHQVQSRTAKKARCIMDYLATNDLQELLALALSLWGAISWAMLYKATRKVDFDV